MPSPTPRPLMLIIIAHTHSQGTHHFSSRQVLMSLCSLPRASSDPTHFRDAQWPSHPLPFIFPRLRDPPQGAALLTHCPHESPYRSAAPYHGLADTHLLMSGLMHQPDSWLLRPSPRSASKLWPTEYCTLISLTSPWGQMASSLTV